MEERVGEAEIKQQMGRATYSSGSRGGLVVGGIGVFIALLPPHDFDLSASNIKPQTNC